MDATNPVSEQSKDMEVAGGCSVCGGALSVRFYNNRAVSICRECHHVGLARFQFQGRNVIFEQIVRAAA